MNNETSPKWAAITSASLFGWNIGLISAFLLAIGVGVISRNLDFPISSKFGITISFLISCCVGLSLGIYSGRKSAKWFMHQGEVRSYIYLILLVIITVFSFPAPFGYIVE